MCSLSANQMLLLGAVGEYMIRYCRRPTMREMASAIGCTPANVRELYDRLIRKGAMRQTPELRGKVDITPLGWSILGVTKPPDLPVHQTNRMSARRMRRMAMWLQRENPQDIIAAELLARADKRERGK